MSDAPIRTLPQARADVVFRRLEDEWVLFDPRRQLLHVVNATGAAVWISCDGETSIGEVVDDLVATFTEPPDRGRIEADVREALDRFLGEELVG